MLADVARYRVITPTRRVAILVSARKARNLGPVLVGGLRAAGISSVECIFGGESSLPEITRHTEELTGSGVDALIAFGGGKCVDAGKAIAHRIGVPVVVPPTLASNDAPCSALSVLYTTTGIYADVESYPLNPLFVIVDTEIVARAPERYIVAGMGDAMATWYEARACSRNRESLNASGGRAYRRLHAS